MTKYEPGGRVKFASSGAMLGRIGTIRLVRKDGHLIVHFDGDPEDSARFIDRSDVVPEIHARSEAQKPKAAQLKREIDEAMGQHRGRRRR